MTTKTCTKCGEEKPKSEFGRHSSHKDGLRSHCKLCHNAASADYHIANRERKNATSAAWKAANRERKKATDTAWHAANPGYSAAYYAENRERIRSVSAKRYASNSERHKTAMRTWRSNNRERVRSIIAAWRAANPESGRIYGQNRRARERDAGGKLSAGIVERLYKLQRGKCACCGSLLGDDYHLDHIMPLFLGGANEDWNTQLLRGVCNLQKHAKHPVEFMQQRGFLL